MVPYYLTFLLAFNHQTKFDSALKQHKLATNCFTTAIQVVKGVSKKFLAKSGKKFKTAILSTTFFWRNEIEPRRSAYFTLLEFALWVKFPCRL